MTRRQRTRAIPGRTVAITGGARGIGRATAAALVGEGADVVIGDIDAETAAETASELGERCRALPLNVTSRESFRSFLDAARASVGAVDVLVNNAGIMTLGSFLEEDDDVAARQFDINVHGVIFGMKLALPEMVRRGSGHVINIASAVGRAGMPGGATYSATKHAVVGLSEAVRAELRGSGVDISVVLPVMVNTELSAGAQGTRGIRRVEAPEVAAAIVRLIERPRAELWVPRSTGVISGVAAAMPQGVRELIARAIDADNALAAFDPATRASYERRAARSGRDLQ